MSKKVKIILIILIMVGSIASVLLYEKTVPQEEVPKEETIIYEGADPLDLKGDFEEEYLEMDALDLNKFLGSAIVRVRPDDAYEYDLPIISKTQEDFEAVSQIMGLNKDWFINFAMSTSKSSTKAYTVAIIRMTEGYEEDVYSAITWRLTELDRQTEGIPVENYLANSYRLEQMGLYLILVVCDNANAVYDELMEAFETEDLDTIEQVPLLTDEEIAKIEEDYLENYSYNNTSTSSIEIVPISDEEREELEEELNEFIEDFEPYSEEREDIEDIEEDIEDIDLEESE